MNGLQVKYIELCSLAIEQPFYVNNYCRSYAVLPVSDFDIQPSAETYLIMSRLNIIYRRTLQNNGFALLTRVEGKNEAGKFLNRFPPMQTDKLTFYLLLANPDLLAFDNLPVQLTPNEIFYFSNSNGDVTADREHLHLSLSATGAQWPNDSTLLSIANFRYQHSSELSNGVSKVKHVKTGAVIQPQSKINSPGKSDLNFDLTSLPPGKCQLLINNIVVKEFYYGPDANRKVFAIIELDLSATVSENYRLIEHDRSLQNIKPRYSILFNNRATTWRYQFLLHSQSALAQELSAMTADEKNAFISQLKLIARNDSSITFSHSATSGNTIEFISDHTLKLREKYYSTETPNEPLILELEKNAADPSPVVVKGNLPPPSPNGLNATAFPQLYSDIFITL